MDFTMAQAKRDQQRGFLCGWEIVECGDVMGVKGAWFIKIESKLGMDGIGFLIDAHSHEPRQFKTIDAAISALRQIGFQAKRIISGLE
jgi:hypothetical protein